eukprot:CAMPEP_0198227360 /NCGR_PEP_ID=MMETSP1445-20131203/108945_1 /TAXON_ID=36898 /ORGANISM="Pyramimonas sp., Strain CCMP2087" /LENGTH=114 /DNA_ID=CAMNT_0043907391 /DNA_START=182 /DNA_END=522 /DNA_ORIENTATION=-
MPPRICNHCARTDTPMWRKGPPEKPSLCNACGARYLSKRTLDGYVPKSNGNPFGAGRVSSTPSSNLKRGRPPKPIETKAPTEPFGATSAASSVEGSADADSTIHFKMGRKRKQA